MTQSVPTKVVREHLFGKDTDQLRERFRFWIRAGLFPDQQKERKDGKGTRRSFNFQDIMVARIIRDLQALTQGRSFELLRKLIIDVRGSIESPLFEAKIVSADETRLSSKWMIVTWAKTEYRVSVIGGPTWAELPENMKQRGIALEGPFIILDLLAIKKQESQWWYGIPA